MLALVLREPQAETVSSLIDRWEQEGTELHAPLLAQYEIATALTRRRAWGEFSRQETDEALGLIDELDVIFDLAPDNARAIEVAMEMGRSSAYDAAYLALAERLDAEVWTLDGPLARNVGNHDRVRLID